jgi:hypothetical protein
MRQSILLAVILSTSVLAGCEQAERHTAVIAADRVPCVGVAFQLCLQVSEDGGPFLYFYDGIDGYQHRWGVETRMSYLVSTVDDPPADGSSLSYELDAIETEVTDPVGTSYELPFHEPGYFAAAGTGQLDMIGTTVACEPALCAEILAATGEYTVSVELTADPSVPLRAIAIN